MDRVLRIRLICMLRINQIHLVGCNHLFLFRQVNVITIQLMIDGCQILKRITPLRTGSIHHMNQELAAFDMRQEFMAEACAVRSPFDQSRDIRHYEPVCALQIHNTKNR